MQAVDVYLMYCALKAHFGKGDYDFVKYGGNSYVVTANHTSQSSIANFYTDLSAGKYSLHIGGNRGRGQVYPTGDKSNNVVFTSSTSWTINSIETIEDGSYKVNIENDNGEITTEAVPVGPQLIVKAQDKINAGDPLTNDPNVGGFGQLDAEVVLQSPYRVIGLIAFFIGVGLTQILLVLKKKQVEKVQAAEGI